MAWATTDDLFVGTLNTSGIDLQKYLDDAEQEMLVCLSKIYVVPLPTDLGALAATFKFIQQRLASGRLILDIAISTENTELNAYGAMLIKEGQNELYKIGYSVELTTATKVGNQGANMAPSISGHDTNSPWTIYEGYVHGHGTNVVTWG